MHINVCMQGKGWSWLQPPQPRPPIGVLLNLMLLPRVRYCYLKKYTHRFTIFHILYFLWEVFPLKVNWSWWWWMALGFSFSKVFLVLTFLSPQWCLSGWFKVERLPLSQPLGERLPCSQHHITVSLSPLILNLIFFLASFNFSRRSCVFFHRIFFFLKVKLPYFRLRLSCLE